jgi:hypothetical protein
MIVTAHQPGYFPWLGLLDKIARGDLYILMDEVQLADRAFQHRNIFMDVKGGIRFLTVDVLKKGYRGRPIRDMTVRGCDWQDRHEKFLQLNYGKCPHFEEVYEKIRFIFSKEYNRLQDVLADSMTVLFEMLDINTPVKLQSELPYDRTARKSGLILSLVGSVNATGYLCGQGARNYMKPEDFAMNGIQIVYHEFSHPVYPQRNAGKNEFADGLSGLDMLFNIGIENAKETFWNNTGRRRALCEK